MKKIFVAILAILVFAGWDLHAVGHSRSSLEPSDQEVSPKAIIEKYIEAVGGEEAVKGIRNMKMIMEAEIQGMSVKILGVTDQENDRTVNVTEMNGNVVAKTVIKGSTGKVVSMGQEQELTAEQVGSMKSQKYIFQELYFDEMGYAVSYGGTEEVEGEKAHKLLLKDSNGAETTEFYSVDSGLKLKTKSDVSGEVWFMDYKEVDGLVMPSKMVVSNPMMPMPMEVNVVSISFNQELEESLFDL
ncbi:hypothetical protein GCM10028791_38900 [Echinicola sediminis]